ncbi:ACT domain protein [Indivirus ILV1]|uniref:ACT domain protein n=1 Tax=Indivirus ILV1 TaxID=1977633 RepID=A0A1V0SCQ5_9VIRU|nr:ACT domain protein [Indivirus ILV1]
MKLEDLVWEKYKGQIKMYHFNKNTKNVKLDLINIMINNKDNKFISVNIYDNEITVYLDEDICMFEDQTIGYDGDYICYQLVNTGSFLEESGLVSMISTKLSEHEIPILYITTSNSNYLFIPNEFQEKTDKILNIDF